MDRVESKFCDSCKKLVGAFIWYVSDLDGELQLLSELCLANHPESDLSSGNVGRLGSAIRSYLDRKDIAQHVLLGEELEGLTDDALVKAETVFIQERCREILADTGDDEYGETEG